MKCNRLRMLPSREEERTLRVIGVRCSALWNATNYQCRQRFLGGHKVPGYSDLCALMRDDENFLALPSDIRQEVIKKVHEAWKSYFRLRALWKRGDLGDKPGLPRYRKARDGSRPDGWIPIKCARSYAIDARYVELTLPADLRGGHGRLRLPHRGLQRYQGKRGRAEMAYDPGRGRWYFRYTVDQPDNALKPRSREAAIDLGVRVAASVSIDGVGASVHFIGREMLKDWDYWGRQIAAHQQELAHRPKAERTSKRLRRMYQRRSTRLEHAWEAKAAQIVRTLAAHQVGTVYVGWPKDIRRDKSYGATWNGRIHNFWGFSRVLHILEKHCARAGIQMVRSGERGSSSTCPECGSRNVKRHPRHVLSCRDCSLRIHSDQAGSRNILRMNAPACSFPKTPGSIRDGAEAAPGPEVRQWTKHCWVDARNPLGQHERPVA
ncbi:hypothetical protein CCR81_01690 [Halorhodospira halophila]|nr:hypothetical protein [Halorhodospira halophila]